MTLDLLRGDDLWLARLVFHRGLALIYLVAFLVALHQFRPPLGERGLLPVPEFVQAALLTARLWLGSCGRASRCPSAQAPSSTHPR